MTQRLACKLITDIILWHQRWRQCFGAVFSMWPSCPCVLGLIVYCWQGWCKKEGPVFSFSLSVCHVDVFPRNPSFLCVLFCSFLPPFVFLSLSLSLSIYSSHCLSPLISPFGPAAAAAGKVLCLFPPHFLPLHSQRLIFWSHISFLFIDHSWLQYWCVLPLCPLFTMEQLWLKHHWTSR